MSKVVTSQLDQKVFQRIADAVPAIVALYDIKTARYIFVNQAITRILGWQPNEFIQGGLEFAISLVHPEDVTPLLAKNQKALDEANRNPRPGTEPIAQFEYRMKHCDGGWRWIHTEGTIFERTAAGEVKLILNASLDVTERKNADFRLKRSLKLLDEMLHPLEPA